jgi:hypothetical protein
VCGSFARLAHSLQFVKANTLPKSSLSLFLGGRHPLMRAPEKLCAVVTQFTGVVGYRAKGCAP